MVTDVEIPPETLLKSWQTKSTEVHSEYSLCNVHVLGAVTVGNLVVARQRVGYDLEQLVDLALGEAFFALLDDQLYFDCGCRAVIQQLKFLCLGETERCDQCHELVDDVGVLASARRLLEILESRAGHGRQWLLVLARLAMAMLARLYVCQQREQLVVTQHARTFVHNFHRRDNNVNLYTRSSVEPAR